MYSYPWYTIAVLFTERAPYRTCWDHAAIWSEESTGLAFCHFSINREAFSWSTLDIRNLDVALSYGYECHVLQDKSVYYFHEEVV